jgi:hypothetical protein
VTAPAIVALLAAAVTTAAATVMTGEFGSASGADPTAAAWRLVVRDARGVLHATAEPPDGRFILRYRNSVYGSLAEERFAISDDGRIILIGLAADEVAVLGEYYGARQPRPADGGDGRRWQASPEEQVALETLRLAATDLGQRTLLVEGRPPIELWQMVDDDAPNLTLAAERVP